MTKQHDFLQPHKGVLQNKQMEQGKLVLPGSAGLDFEPVRRIIDTYESEFQPNQPTCLAFGDSVSLRVSDGDSDKRRLPQFIEFFLRRVNLSAHVIDVSFSAFNLRIYCAMLELLASCRHRPGFVLLPLNIRSFSPQWFDNPLWQFGEHLSLIKNRAINRYAPLGPVAPVYEVADSYLHYDSVPVSTDYGAISTIGDYRALVASQPTDEMAIRARKAGILAVHYGVPIAPSHQLLEELSQAVSLLQKLRVSYCLYLTPLNIQALTRDASKATVLQLRANLEFIKEYAQKLGTTALDFSHLVNDNGFLHKGLQTEHLSEQGRILLAERLAEIASRA